jgi:hypothetical protein
MNGGYAINALFNDNTMAKNDLIDQAMHISLRSPHHPTRRKIPGPTRS